MRKSLLVVSTALGACLAIWAADWPSQGGGPQRDGWAKFEKAFTKENVAGLQLLYTYNSDNRAIGMNALTPPLVNGLLITYLGFKEMLVFGGSSDTAYSVDADLNRLIWKTQFQTKTAASGSSKNSGACSGGLTAALAMPGSSEAPGRGARFRRVPVPPPATANPAPAPPPTVAPPVRPAAPPPEPGLLATGFGRPGAFLAVSSDGNLHVLNTATGADRVPPIPFLPAGANAGSLNVSDETVYASTSGDCGGNPNGIYAADLSAKTPQLASFKTNGSGPVGTAIGKNGVVYAQLENGRGEVAGDYNDTLMALGSKTLAVKDYFTPASKAAASSSRATPIVFDWKGKDVVLASGSDGSLYLLDSTSLGGPDHHQPLAKTESIGTGVHGFASWEDPSTSKRWVYVSLWGKGAHGSLAAFTVQDKDGHPTLTSEWTSQAISTPAPAAIANGLVFVLSTGDTGKKNARAALYALEAATGKELYSSHAIVKSFAHNGGLAIANSRIYFTTHDNAVYCFGFFADQLQLTGK